MFMTGNGMTAEKVRRVRLQVYFVEPVIFSVRWIWLREEGKELRLTSRF